MKKLMFLLWGLTQSVYGFTFSQEPVSPLEAEFANSIEIISEPEGGIVHLFEMFVDEHNRIDSFIRTSSKSQQKVTLAEMNAGDVQLADVDGRPALKLRCENCTADEGGEVVLTYLYNGIMMSYREFRMTLEKDDNQVWNLYAEDGEKIESLYMVSRKLLGRLIGIKTILVNPTEDDLLVFEDPDMEASSFYKQSRL